MHYKNEKDETICVEKCPKERSLIADEKLCFSNCNDAGDFKYYFEGICYKDCTNCTNLVLDQVDITTYTDAKIKEVLIQKYKNFSDNICYCNGGIWYEDKEENKYIYNCTKVEGEKNCTIFKNDYKYLIHPTSECVKVCPEGFKFF